MRRLLQLMAAVFLFLFAAAVELRAQAVVITEFLAENRDGLLDEDEESSDWIEIQNQGGAAVNLEGWYLTDDADDLMRWSLPATEILPGGYLLVFASGKDRAEAGSELHTNFRIDGSGEFLALVDPAGGVVHSFTPAFPPQRANISYGFSQRASQADYLRVGASGRLWIPEDGGLGSDWKGADYDDSLWEQVETGIGFATGDIPLPPAEIENVALDGRATQSSEGWGGSPGRAIDGNTSGQWGDASITHTNASPSWWEVDLRETFTIEEIVLWNRLDCCSERLTNFTVRILDEDREETYEETFLSDGSRIDGSSFAIGDIVAGGRYVRISIPGQYLSLAEVQVFGQVFDGDLGFNRQLRTDIGDEMLGRNASAYLRMPFGAENPGNLDTLTLKMKYDDGFVAYLNGTEVARRNADGDPGWNSAASRENPRENVLVFEEFDLSGRIDLLREGGNVLAIHGLNLSPEDDDFLLVPELVGFRFSEQLESYLLDPTPGETNAGEALDGFVADTTFSQDRGFYDESFEVVIATETEGAEIRYTLNNSLPTANSGTRYTGPVRISTTTTLRAAAFKNGLGPTNTDTHTYIFLDNVINSNVMRRNITQDRVFAPQMRASLTDLPSLCITSPRAINGSSEVLISLELIHPGGEEGFQEDAGGRYYGGAFTNFAKKNFRIYFRSEYGDSKLRYPLFDGHAHSISPVEVFDHIELRAGSHDMNQRGFYMSNRFTDDTMLDMGNLNPHGRFIHLYLNGTYWGQYHLRERWSADMLAQYLGGEKEDYEAINGNWNVGGWPDPGVPFDGDGSAWERIKSLRSDFEAVSPYLDVRHYVDYMLMFMFGNSEDEYRCVGPTGPGSGFKFVLNDADGFTRSVSNRTSMGRPGRSAGDGPGSIFSMLLRENHPDYRILLADRIQELFFNDGPMTPAKMSARLLERCDQVERAFISEAARWNFRTPQSWAGARDSYVNGVLPTRTSQVITEYRRAGFMLPEPVPSFLVNGRAQHGGAIRSGAELAMGVEGLQRFVIRRQLFDADSPFSVCIPRNGNMGTEWTLPDYEEGSNGETWQSGSGGAGYDTGDDYEDAIGIDLLAEMRGDGGNPSAFIRIPFDLADQAALASIDNLTLLIDFDDGFIAYLNGEPLAAENAPDDGPEWDSRSRRSHEADIDEADAYELPGFEEHLRVGRNVLAIHGLNSSVNSSDFIIRAELVDRVIEVGLPADSVFYTLDGSDPRLPGGAVSPAAISYTGPATLTGSTLVTARGLGENGDWSAKVDAVFYTDMPLRVTEIMYNPAEPAEDSPFRRREFEFIELQNVSANTIDLTGVRFVEGIEFDFTGSAVTELGSGELVVLVEDIEGFASRYDLARVLVAGEYSGALSDGGERISIQGALGEPILDFEYGDLWHPETDGEGPSLVIVDALDELPTWGEGESWRPSNVDLGSPGIDESGLAPRGRQLPGDANQDTRVDISDAVALLLHLFGRRPDLPPCDDGKAGNLGNVGVLDSNGDNEVNVSDAVWLLAYMYQGGAPPTRGTRCVRLEGCPNVCGF